VISVDDDTGGSLHLDVTGDDGVQWGVVAAAWQEDGPAVVVSERSEGATVAAELDLTGATQVMVGVANLGRANLNAEARHPRNTFTLSFRRDAAVVDADDTGSTEVPSPRKQEETSGCGCSTGSGSSLGLVALTLLAARRRRVQIDRAAPFTVHGRAPPPAPPEPNGSLVSPPRPHRLHHGH
jgi:MYXO-CTERM domain-containing protein